MSSGIERQAADLTFSTPYARTTVTTSERLEIPSGMAEKFAVFFAETSAVHIRFGPDDVVVDEGDRSSVSSEALTAAGEEPHITVPAGTERHVRLKAAWTHFAHKSADTSGVLRFGCAEGSDGSD